MATIYSNEKQYHCEVTHATPSGSSDDLGTSYDGNAAEQDQIQHDLEVTEDDLLEAKEAASLITLDELKAILQRVHKAHELDPNFPFAIIKKIELFLGNPDVFKRPDKYDLLIRELKLEAALITGNSPYAEVRAVVDKTDDPSTPCSTIRSWTIGLFFTVILAFINQVFDQRLPPIRVQANVSQMLAYPLGKLWEALAPDWGITLFGTRHSLNPGRFSKKEHMLITIMANVAHNTPYTTLIVLVQWLPRFFNQPWAASVTYQLLMALSTNFIGYGMAGICRRFLVYPAYTVWPSSLVTIALNSAFHNDKNSLVAGPFKKIYSMSRLKLFAIAFALMFVYFFIPNFLWTSLSSFSWMTWIAPDNKHLTAVAGFNHGVGLNPWPTFDWNIVAFDGTDPLMIPFFSSMNKFLGAFFSSFAVLGIWYSNSFNTGYLPMNDGGVYDNMAERYNVSRAIDDRGLFYGEEYEKYSPPFLTAGAISLYMAFFAIYSSCMTYAVLYHRHEIAMGFRSLINSFRNKKDVEDERNIDIHWRLMKQYTEVPEWWYSLVLLAAIILGVAGVSAFETYTTPGVVFYGIFLCLVFVIPVGIVQSITGIEVTLNVIAEFIGGVWVEGNALAMNYFKAFGFVTCSHAILFSSDLKLAHYLKLPPRQTFSAQIIATLISTFICVGVLNFQMHSVPGFCTEDAKWKLTCPSAKGFFTASVLWGTVGPKKIWGDGGMYPLTLIAFPVGVVSVVIFYFLTKKFSNSRWLRQVHPVAIFYGCNIWAPYNVSYMWPSVPIAWLSWMYVKPRFLGFWSKYNFVLSAALSSGIAIAGIILFFCIQWQGVEEPDWWGNRVTAQGCEAEHCVLKTLDLANGEYMGPRVGTFH